MMVQEKWFAPELNPSKVSIIFQLWRKDPLMSHFQVAEDLSSFGSADVRKVSSNSLLIATANEST